MSQPTRHLLQKLVDQDPQCRPSAVSSLQMATVSLHKHQSGPLLTRNGRVRHQDRSSPTPLFDSESSCGSSETCLSPAVGQGYSACRYIRRGSDVGSEVARLARIKEVHDGSMEGGETVVLSARKHCRRRSDPGTLAAALSSFRRRRSNAGPSESCNPQCVAPIGGSSHCSSTISKPACEVMTWTSEGTSSTSCSTPRERRRSVPSRVAMPKAATACQESMLKKHPATQGSRGINQHKTALFANLGLAE